MHRLITIRVSHYNEKARWASDRLGVPLERFSQGLGELRATPAGIHVLRMFREERNTPSGAR